MSNVFVGVGTPIEVAVIDMDDSYVTLADAEAYMATRLDSRAWDNATESNRQKALITASQSYIRLLNFKDDIDLDEPNTDIQHATVIIAKELLDGFNPEAERQTLSVKSQTLKMSETLDTPAMDSYRQLGLPSFEAWTLLYPYLIRRKLPISRIS